MKTAIIFFAVIFCATFVTARLGNQRTLSEVSFTVQDFDLFAESMWDELSLGHEYEDFQNCMHQQDQAGVLLAKSISNFNSTDANDVKLGLKRLGKALQVITAAIVKCQGKARYWKTFQEMIDAYTKPENLTFNSGSTFTIDGIEVFADMKKIVEYCSTQQIAKCGSVLGDAIGKVYYGQVDINSPETIQKINSIPNLTWTAGVNSVFNRTNLWQFKRERVSLRHIHSKKDNSTNTSEPREDGSGKRNLQAIPTNFDSRSRWPYCIHGIRDQGACASCWAVASAEVLEDRFCIASNRAINTVLGPQYQVSCDVGNGNNGCNRGYLKQTWQFLENKGLVTEKCFPYTSHNFVVPSCSSFTRCQDGTAMRKYYAKSGSSRQFSGISAIQQEIYTNGPVVAAIQVYSDLMSYTGGIYKQAWGSYLGGHAIKIIGWGQQNGINYWIVSNSWGKTWGETGHFRVAFGQIGIESQGYAGLADLTRQW